MFLFISGYSGQNPGKTLESVGGTSVNETDIDVDINAITVRMIIINMNMSCTAYL